MADGTYSDEAPDASVGERVANSIRKTVSAVAQMTGPASITQIKARHDAEEAAANGDASGDVLGRMKQAQSTDKDNSYQY